MNTTIENLISYLQGAPFAAVLLNVLLKSLVVLALAGGVCAVWRSASSATRHLVWFLAVASLPFLPLLNSTGSAWQRPAWAISSSAGSGNQISLALELAPKPVTQSTPNLPEAPKISSPPDSGARSRTATAHFNAQWMLVGQIVWLAGAVVVLMRMAGGQFYRRKLTLGTHRLQDAEWTRLLKNTGEALHLRHPVTLLQSPNNVMPMTWGWWRPVVLLPAEAAQWPVERRRVVLLHELAHIKRADYLTQVLVQIVCAIYWFNPLVWLAARQMCVEREGACDDLVLTGGCKASDYAGHLVDIAGSFRRVPQMAAIAMARSSQLEGRIAAIVDQSRNRRLRSAAAVAVLALIGGIAICLGSGGPASTVGTEKSDSLLKQQIEQLQAFSKLKENQSETLAAAAGEKITPEFQRYFDAAINGDFQTVTNMYEAFKRRHPQYAHTPETDMSLRTSYWGPVLEISLAYDQVIRCEPAYTQIAVNGIINSIPAGSIYFGGTDPGRGLPTAFCKSHVDGDPFYTLTQNALADGTYLEYLQKTYGNQKNLLGKLAEACRSSVELQTLNGPGMSEEVEKLKAEMSATQVEITEAQKEGNSGKREAKVSELERKAKLQKSNFEYFINQLEQSRQDEPKAIAKRLLAETAGQEAGTNVLYIPTEADAQQCFQDYIVDAQKRLANNQLKPGEDVKSSEGRVQVSGQVAVMEINARLAKIIFDKNPGHEFYIEESFPLDWMYPYLEPHGLIMKINREPLAELSEGTVQQDRDFWRPRVAQMIGGWLSEYASLKDVIDFGEKVFLRHDLDGFSGDPHFVQNDYASRSFSKWRSAIAGLYAWRAEHGADTEKKQMAAAADFAFRQALALCPYSPELTARYVAFLKQQQREADAQSVQSLADHFKAQSAASGPVFQIRLALDVPTDNTEPMRLESPAGATSSAQTLYVAKEFLLDNTAVQSAAFDQNQLGYSEIDVVMTDAGRKQFAEITRQHLHQRLAIIIDGKLWMAPVVQSPITEGKANITGSFSDEIAKQLTAKINAAAGK